MMNHFQVVLNMRSNTNEKILDRCPTFVTKDKVGMFRMKMATKRSIQVKGHQFMLNAVNLTVYCYQCRDAVWGVNAQAYFCQSNHSTKYYPSYEINLFEKIIAMKKFQ